MRDNKSINQWSTYQLLIASHPRVVCNIINGAVQECIAACPVEAVWSIKLCLHKGFTAEILCVGRYTHII